MEVTGLKSRTIKERDDILKAINEALKKNKISLKEKDILVIASKVLALSQGRVSDVSNVDYKKGELKKIIKKEGGKLFETNYCWLTYKDNHLIPNAGIDKSNVPKGKIVLWPKTPYKQAEKIQSELRKKHKLKKLGVIISDSTCAPLRPGVHGISIGHFGFEGIEDCRSKKDIHGKRMQVTRRALADSLASAALIVMGETAEKKPFAVISEPPVKFTNRHIRRSTIKLESDLFYGVYNSAFKKFISKKR